VDRQPVEVDQTTTVEDELALAIGAGLTAGLTPNRIAHLLVETGWQNPRLAYLNDLEATRP
jgi:hypothetical protein